MADPPPPPLRHLLPREPFVADVQLLEGHVVRRGVERRGDVLDRPALLELVGGDRAACDVEQLDLPSTRDASAPLSIVAWRHFQMSMLSSTPRLSVMFDHLMPPATFLVYGRPLASIDLCSITSVSESNPEASLNTPTLSFPPSVNRKYDAGRGSLIGI